MGQVDFLLSPKTNDDTQTLLGGYAPCGSALVITLLQKYRFPLSPEQHHPSTDTQSTHTHKQQTVCLTVSDRRSQTRTLILKVYIHSFSSSFRRCSLLELHRSERSSGCRTTKKFTSSIRHEISSSPSQLLDQSQ